MSAPRLNLDGTCILFDLPRDFAGLSACFELIAMIGAVSSHQISNFSPPLPCLLWNQAIPSDQWTVKRNDMCHFLAKALKSWCAPSSLSSLQW